MNCEKCEELIGDLLDGALNSRDELTLNSHLEECLNCASVRTDLDSILSFCRANRGQYSAVPNDKALWLRIRNVIEASNADEPTSNAVVATRNPIKSSWMRRRWELSLPQLTASAAAMVMVVSLITFVGLRRWDRGAPVATTPQVFREATNLNDRLLQQRQVISYWNQRIELNKARWNPTMRETFDRNMKVIDEAVSESLNDLNRNPHDEVSEQMLNDALNDKLSLLKEFADL
jgi:Putative zinc-finger